MSGFTLLLVLLSAITHAGWNLAGKKAGPSIGYFWLASLWGFVLGLPLILPFTWPLLLALTPPIWAWLPWTARLISLALNSEPLSWTVIFSLPPVDLSTSAANWWMFSVWKLLAG